ncbi:hypothetical protein I5M27_05620 [Adhaeribacter sp. BT258]|uniref:Uncharacterized protein n=1 Tax=Adhaeribacter terrigena TaxID=2793070 RepID=A0ABS1BZ73_9BACT|nr:hypothetical protein [Adhaeribacter terrigena]MBK0402454.1 hypothetical protein [Adhaeribacter terrigena]
MKNEEKNPEHESRRNKSETEYKRDQANGNIGHPGSKRNIGLGGEMQRADQKDELENLHISGNEVSGYGATNHTDAGENAAGPGFEAEGSEYSNDNPVKDDDDIIDKSNECQ